MEYITVGAIAMLAMELLKWLWRVPVSFLAFKWFGWTLVQEFDPKVYLVVMPLLTAVAPFALLALGVPIVDPILVMGWVAAVQYLARVLLTAIIGTGLYNVTLKPYKRAEKEYLEK